MISSIRERMTRALELLTESAVAHDRGDDKAALRLLSDAFRGFSHARDLLDDAEAEHERLLERMRKLHEALVGAPTEPEPTPKSSSVVPS